MLKKINVINNNFIAKLAKFIWIGALYLQITMYDHLLVYEYDNFEQLSHEVSTENIQSLHIKYVITW